MMSPALIMTSTLSQGPVDAAAHRLDTGGAHGYDGEMGSASGSWMKALSTSDLWIRC